jgi:GNAT superfamily N-acetyltransferase
MQKQLAGGLVLRTLSENYPSDRARLADFYASINTEDDPEEIKEGLRNWVRDLMDGHPTVTSDDFFVVVDPAKNDLLVSATLLIPQTWRYEDIEIPVGRPELVATHAEYRNRGLVRALFEAVHERSELLGHHLQVITGIPHFYRQFGYTMAVELGPHVVFSLDSLEAPKPDYKPAFTLRPATFDDIPRMEAWCNGFAQQRLLTDIRIPDQWRYELAGRRVGSFMHTDYQIIVDAHGQGVGYLALATRQFEKWNARCMAYVVGDDSSYLATFQDVMRGVKTWTKARLGDGVSTLYFATGLHETLDRLIENTAGGHVRKHEYAWYLRVPDLVGFLKTITPVLERRLEGSGANGYTGELKIGFLDQRGIRIQFEQGCIANVSAISGKDGYEAEFPWNLFLNVLFGYQTYDEIRHHLADTYANGKAIVLMETLFPKKRSWLRGLA